VNAHDGSRARRGASIAVAGLALTSIVATGLVGGSTAAWTDSEWVETASAGLDCTAPGLGTSTAAGTMLGGELLGLDLATIVELDKIENGAAVQEGLLSLTGQRTVPNVFVNGKHLGGSSDTQEAARSGRLQELLADGG